MQQRFPSWVLQQHHGLKPFRSTWGHRTTQLHIDVSTHRGGWGRLLAHGGRLGCPSWFAKAWRSIDSIVSGEYWVRFAWGTFLLNFGVCFTGRLDLHPAELWRVEQGNETRDQQGLWGLLWGPFHVGTFSQSLSLWWRANAWKVSYCFFHILTVPLCSSQTICTSTEGILLENANAWEIQFPGGIFTLQPLPHPHPLTFTPPPLPQKSHLLINSNSLFWSCRPWSVDVTNRKFRWDLWDESRESPVWSCELPVWNRVLKVCWLHSKTRNSICTSWKGKQIQTEQLGNSEQGYLVGIWFACGWYVVCIWLVCSRYVIGMWLVYNR